MNEELVLTPPEPKQLTPMDMMAQVLQTQNPKDAVEVVKELAKLQMEMRKQDAEVEFNKALADCEDELKLVVNDSDKTAPGGKKWATYKALNKELRPLLKKYGLGLSFGTSESTVAEQMIMQAYVSKGLHTRTYSLPMDIGGKGPQGAGALSKPHAIGAGVEYGRRYLVKMIFNLVTGDEGEQGVTNGELVEQLEFLENAKDPAELKRLYTQYANLALDNADKNAIAALKAAKAKKQEEFDAD